jgi:hypothetical protein
VQVRRQSLVCGPLAAFISEQFGTAARYTGASLDTLATLIGGGFSTRPDDPRNPDRTVEPALSRATTGRTVVPDGHNQPATPASTGVDQNHTAGRKIRARDRRLYDDLACKIRSSV